jgi:hypothetical protein
MKNSRLPTEDNVILLISVILLLLVIFPGCYDLYFGNEIDSLATGIADSTAKTTIFDDPHKWIN